jgi:hypothetical protein
VIDNRLLVAASLGHPPPNGTSSEMIRAAMRGEPRLYAAANTGLIRHVPAAEGPCPRIP